MLSHLALSLLTKIPSRRECAKGFGELGMRTVSFSDFSAANAPMRTAKMPTRGDLPCPV